jgi:hypothetical protein
VAAEVSLVFFFFFMCIRGLIGGYFSSRFGKDERLTEGYVEDIWADGYGGF